MSQITTRRLTTADVNKLQQISIEIFKDTFGAQNTSENMAAYLQDAYNLPKLTHELAEPESQFYFVERAGESLGYLKLNTGAAQSEAMGPDTLEVERIYIRKAFQHQGLGNQLCNKRFKLLKLITSIKFGLAFGNITNRQRTSMRNGALNNSVLTIL
ncbi:transcription repressor [Lactiplantibacillus plantarum JDM1]|nr:transcription repressor [Lactiplantibacillus plantarum JDM1]